MKGDIKKTFCFQSQERRVAGIKSKASRRVAWVRKHI